MIAQRMTRFTVIPHVSDWLLFNVDPWNRSGGVVRCCETGVTWSDVATVT